MIHSEGKEYIVHKVMSRIWKRNENTPLSIVEAIIDVIELMGLDEQFIQKEKERINGTKNDTVTAKEKWETEKRYNSVIQFNQSSIKYYTEDRVRELIKLADAAIKEAEERK